MPDWLIAALIGSVPGIAAIGAVFWRVGRVERDAKETSTEMTRLALEVATLKANAAADVGALTRHFTEDMIALGRIDDSVKDMRRELLDAISVLRADIRAIISGRQERDREDSGVHRRADRDRDR